MFLLENQKPTKHNEKPYCKAKVQVQHGEKGHQYVMYKVQQSHHVDHHLSEGVFLFLAEVLEDVTVVFLQQFEAHSEVVILQHRGIVVHQCQF